MRRAVVFALALALVPAVVEPGAGSAARAESRASYGGTLVGSLTGEPTSLDPVLARSHAEVTLVGLVFDALYQVLPDGRIAPQLAAALPALDGAGTSARIALRRGVTFHDGHALEVADVVASLRRLRAAAPGLLPGVTAVSADGDDLVVRLAAPVPELAALLAVPATAVTRGGTAPTDGAAIGTGPFAIRAVERSKRRIRLTAHAGHVAGRPFVDELQLDWFGEPAGEAKRYETGGAQVAARGASVFAGHAPRYATVELESAATVLSYVSFGRAHAAVTGNLDFRRALHLALVRSGLAGTGIGERLVPAASPIAADLGGPAMAASAAAGDLEAAQAALGKAAAKVADLGADRRAGLDLKILVETSRFDDRELAERVARALDKLGIGAAIEAVTPAALRSKVASGAYDLAIGQLAPVGSLAATWLLAFEAGGSSWARDRLARGTFDGRAAEAEFAASLPIMPLVHRAIRYQLRTDVRGVGVDASARLVWADLFFFGRPRKAT